MRQAAAVAASGLAVAAFIIAAGILSLVVVDYAHPSATSRAAAAAATPWCAGCAGTARGHAPAQRRAASAAMATEKESAARARDPSAGIERAGPVS
jgi:hypothetical protein